MALIRPGTEYFVGRDETIAKLVGSIRRDNAVLLYGGRQSGKTSTLLAITRQMRAKTASVTELSALDVPVYIDLTALKYDATPSDFFALLLSKTHEAFIQQVDGLTAKGYSPTASLHEFVQSLRELRVCCGEVDARPIFLLDEAKRILGSRFPRGFQDNLFSILYGELADEARCAIVFAGSQHLNDFLKDDTSPIGSRAGTVILEVLGPDAIRALVGVVLPGADAAIVDQIAVAVGSFTGGHAGTLAKLLEEHSLEPSTGIEAQANMVYERSLALFENWTLSFSAEAITIVNVLIDSPRLSLSEVSSELESRKLQRYLARRAVEELRYTGIVVWENECITRCNDIYWKFIREFGPSGHSNISASDAQSVWSKIEQTELTLRQLVERKFRVKYKDTFENAIKDILGQDAWDAILRAKKRGIAQYKFSPGGANRDLMSCMYLGQLGSLMLNRETWPLFKDSYRDKRELEDRLAAIAPVRTDRAHFVTVPQKELDRCRIACDDLAVIVERELSTLES